MNMHRFIVLFLILLISHAASATEYKLDLSHSSITFKVKHLMIATVTGRFEKFEGSYDFDKKSGKISGLKVKIQATSLDTNEKDRDEHLRSPDFFNVQKHPTIAFRSTDVSVKNKKPVKITGMLTMNGTTKPIAFDFDFKGIAKDPWGNYRMIFEATAKLDRRDYGLVWNKALDKGGLLIGNEVQITVQGQALPRRKT